MAHNNDLDPKLNEHLRQHYAVNPQPNFLPELKNDLLGQFPGQRRTLFKRYRFAFGLIATALVLVIVLLATPLGKALAQEFVELFSRAESDSLPYPPGQTAIAEYATQIAASPTNTPETQSSPTQAPTRTPDPASSEGANMTIEEIEQAAGFDVLVPSLIPSKLKFTGGSYLSEENITSLFYGLLGNNYNGLRISQEPITDTDDCDLCSEIGPAANIKSVQIGDVPGELVSGVWELKDGYKIWRNEPWVVRLRWQTNDTVFELSYFGTPGSLTKTSMVHIAESMASSNEPLARFSVTPTPAPTQTTIKPDPSKLENANMTLAEVEQAAGFDILAPTYLANHDFYGANFDPITGIVYLFYQEGLTIRQESFARIADCDLCAKVINSAVSRFTEVGDIVAELLVDSKFTKMLRWQDGNMFFEISYHQDPGELNFDDLIQIAESIQ